MRGLHLVLSFAAILGACMSCHPSDKPSVQGSSPSPSTHPFAVVHSDAEWRQLLTREQYRVTRQKGTERAFTGEYTDLEVKGVYLCVGCGQELFGSETKFHSGTGWPSFWQPIKPEAVSSDSDGSYGMDRMEVICSRCGAHLGHVFDDGPAPTHLRYCINSVALKLKPSK
jgi:peptide-methionine (R)-S-oxide reductase